VTVKLQVFVCPHRSLAVTLTVLVPIGKMLPLGGVADTVGELQPPAAATLKKTVMPDEFVALTKMLLEQVSASAGGETRKAW
jgi:hypothetical protein